MSNRILTFGDLSVFAAEAKVKFAQRTALSELATKVSTLESTGGQANVLEGVNVNGAALTIADKMVDILIATGTSNGTISVNNAEVAVAGLQALAFKAQVSEADMDDALKAVIAAKASGADLEALTGRVITAEDAITTINGDASVEGSMKNLLAKEFAALTGNDTEIKSLQALVDWADEHAADALELSNQVATNKTDIATLTALIGALPEGITSTTVVDYIAEAIAAIGIGDYMKTADADAKYLQLSGGTMTGTLNASDIGNVVEMQFEKGNAIYGSRSIKYSADTFTFKGETDDGGLGYAYLSIKDGKLAFHAVTVGQMNTKFADYTSTADLEANYVQTSSVGTITEDEVKALLA